MNKSVNQFTYVDGEQCVTQLRRLPRLLRADGASCAGTSS